MANSMPVIFYPLTGYTPSLAEKVDGGENKYLS